MSARVLIIGLASATAVAQVGSAQTPIPEWRLSAQQLVIDGTISSLHRVRGAAILSDGKIVLADAGNNRLLLYSVDGAQIRVLGREGTGPGDVQLIWDLAVLSDTILTYDTGLSRVSLWTPTDGFVRSTSLASMPGQMLELRAFVTPSEFVVTRRTARAQSSKGLFTDTVSVLRFHASPQAISEIERRAWDQRYFYPQGNGATTYVTPFLGSAHVAVAGRHILTVPLAGAEVVIRAFDDGDTAVIQLPVSRRPFDRTLVNAYRDSLLRLRRQSTVPMPGAEQRIHDVFGPAFPLPRLRPVIENAKTVGADVWLRTFEGTGSAVDWYVINPSAKRLVARLSLPASWRLLGGTGGKVLILKRDADGVESVSVHAILRTP
ncbi:hypothetical protein PLCT1_00132 [Planctomycetaceae bacterium]|nr:hypothetical protein PLCT1_00132 [Planctomycetaceae bacterium]